MNWQERVVEDPGILSGKPTIKGTRISVELVLQNLGAGWSESDLLSAYPRLTREDIAAACAYAAHAISLSAMAEIDRQAG